MAKEVKARFKISEGIITIQGKKLWEKEMLERFGKDCDVVVADFRKPVRKRSNGQNGYYHKIVIQFIYDALIQSGYDKKELDHDIVHDFLRNKFNTHEIVSEHGESIKIVRATSDLTTVEFMNYIADIQRWASTTLNIYIPDPNEQSQLEY